MEKRKVKIYYTSDVHGYFYPTSYGDREVKPMGLFACASEYKKDDDTLVIDGGDMLQGSAYAYYSRNILGSCEYIAQMVNDCGYDFYTLGNHDLTMVRNIRPFTAITIKVFVYVRMCLTAREIFYIRI